jgi:CDP-4-dehydro-6-deoxyglucose reductase
MTAGAAPRRHPTTAHVVFGGAWYASRPGETVLDTLLRQGVDAPYSCRKGTCLVCMMRCTSGTPSPAAQEPLSETLRAQGHVLACRFVPKADVEIVSPNEAAAFVPAEIVSNTPLGPTVRRLRLRPSQAFSYQPGQFLNLRAPNGHTRSYSLASLPQRDPDLELHIRRMENGVLSGWVFEQARPGDRVDVSGPFGRNFYVPGRPDQPMLMVGTGTGLAPLVGILRDALRRGHKGPIRLYHGTRHQEALYLDGVLREVANRQPNLHYFGCVSGDPGAKRLRQGRADALAFADLASLAGWRVFLSGNPQMVHATRKSAYLAGAALADIHADPFDLRDLRHHPRP